MLQPCAIDRPPATRPGPTRPGRIARLIGGCALLAACSVVAPPGVSSNRPDGEGYAGRGELVLRLAATDHGGGLLPWPPTLPGLSAPKVERATVELRYLGLDDQGRAEFQRHDVDTLAGPPVLPPAESPEMALGRAAAAHHPPAALDTRRIVVDLRLARQIQIQGKIIEIVEATATGVVFRIY